MKAFAVSLRSAALAIMVSGALAAGAAAQEPGDPVLGAKVFKKCAACHTVEAGKKSPTGPSLHGLFGRTAGTLEGFAFSDAMKEAGAAGRVWDEASLTEYLRDPKKSVPKTKMAFVGLKKDADLANVIAYLKQASAE